MKDISPQQQEPLIARVRNPLALARGGCQLEEVSRIPDLGKKTYLALREYYKELKEKE